MIVNVWDWKNNIKASHDIVLPPHSHIKLRPKRLSISEGGSETRVEIDVWITEIFLDPNRSYHNTISTYLN